MITLVSDLGKRISTVISAPAAELVTTYFTDRRFAGATFDDLGSQEADRFTSDDLLAVSLLNVSWNPHAVRSLLHSPDAEFNSLLSHIDTDVDLWEADVALLDRAAVLYAKLKALPGVKRTRTSKLMARKRPRLVPIADSVIVRQLGFGDEVWAPLRAALQDSELRDSIESLRPQGLSKEHVSTLRLLDVATWMRGSRSKAAVQARRRAGLER
jgi:hypothetical protein